MKVVPIRLAYLKIDQFRKVISANNKIVNYPDFIKLIQDENYDIKTDSMTIFTKNNEVITISNTRGVPPNYNDDSDLICQEYTNFLVEILLIEDNYKNEYEYFFDIDGCIYPAPITNGSDEYIELGNNINFFNDNGKYYYHSKKSACHSKENNIISFDITDIHEIKLYSINRTTGDINDICKYHTIDHGTHLSLVKVKENPPKVNESPAESDDSRNIISIIFLTLVIICLIITTFLYITN